MQNWQKTGGKQLLRSYAHFAQGEVTAKKITVNVSQHVYELLEGSPPCVKLAELWRCELLLVLALFPFKIKTKYLENYLPCSSKGK